MQAIEFEAEVRNGIIKVPELFQRNTFQQAHIILLFPDSQPEESKVTSSNSEDRFGSASIETHNFKFNRVEANVR